MMRAYRSYIKICYTSGCPNYAENPMVDYCASCAKNMRKAEKQAIKDEQKRKQIFSKKREPRAKISKNPKDWTNTFSCSSGKKVTQAEINRNRDSAYNYQAQSTSVTKCHGCGQPATCRAHIIAQARCKQIGKTELIWHLGNFFPSCYECNSAIENPKGKDWQNLNNIDKCLEFIRLNDSELFAKFEVSRLSTNKTI